MSESEIKQPKQDRMTFHYIKSNFFRVVHASGVHGGISPKGEFQMAFFNERTPIPQRVYHDIQIKDGVASLGPEIESERVGKDGVIREVDVEVLMSRETAKVVHTWLGERLAQFDKLS